MKTTIETKVKMHLEFDIPKEQHEYSCAVNATKYYDALWVILRHLKQEINSKNHTDEYVAAVLDISDKITEILSDLNIDINANQ
jgi:hypothetical protein